MIGEIRYIANLVDTPPPNSRAVNFSEFMVWVVMQKAVQLDIETTVHEQDCEKEIRTIQFGSCTQERIQWFFQWSELSADEKNFISNICSNQDIEKLIHRAAFEYVILRFHGIRLEFVYDTMLAEKVLRGGLEIENYALADISWKYLRIIMDKSLQTSFADNIITADKMIYAITDVAYLDIIRKVQIETGGQEKLLNVIGLENEAVLAFSEISYNGMILDQNKWRENLQAAYPVVAAAKSKIDAWLHHPDLNAAALRLGYISKEDRSQINYNSPPQKTELVQMIFPDLVGTSQNVLKAYIRDHTFEPEKLNILLSIRDKNYQPLNDWLITNHREELIKREYLVPAGEATINWNSRDQALPILKVVEPKLKDLSAESTGRCSHPAVKDRTTYCESLKLITTYGESFIQEYVDTDGRVRTNFNQVVSTGRVSSSDPNMQNIIVTEEVGTRYRNAFVCEPGCSFVDSDYSSQEIVIIAHMSKAPAWIEAIRKKQDIHSVCAELVYKDKWLKGTEDGCAYYKMAINVEGVLEQAKQKCECKKHKQLRYDVKTINFMLAYGGGKFKLASELEISVPQAEALIEEYYATFPMIKRTLALCGDFGLKNGYILTLAPFNRKRWFPLWREYKDYVDIHQKGIKFISPLGEIERASMNHPVQGTAADMVKVAMVTIRSFIRDNNLWETVKLVAQVHDQITTTCVDEKCEWWKVEMDRLMCEAGELIIPSGILKADTNITPTWTK